jgi:serine/threonine-protein kinase
MYGFSGKYRLDARLGGGGMAEVFMGSTVGAEGFSRRIAIKRVLPGFSENPAFAQMFIDEARISSRLAHPNIVSVLDFDRDPEGRLYLVMELVEGKDLDALASTGPLPLPVIIFVISEMLRGLGHAHDLPAVVDPQMMSASQTINSMRGLVHRDVSPHNVLLSWEGAVKVSDFGIAKARTASNATASVFIKGKPAYMSPEQANGQPLDGRSDLFAVGVMLWEMLVGRRLFVGEDTRATLAAVLFGQIPRPRSIRGDIPKDLERVTMKLLERDLPARYATAEQAIHDLLECADAPKSGREQLIKVLAERFPQQAPVRHSVLRQRGTPPQVAMPQHELPTYQRETIVGHGGPVPAAALPSLGAVRNTPTGTMQPAASIPKPGRTGRRLAIGIAVLVAAGLVTFAIVSAVKKKSSTAEEVASGAVAGSGSSMAAASPTPPPPAPIDASPPDAAQIVQAPPDAAVEGPKKDATGSQTAQAGDKRMGRLVVRAFPVLTVYVDNRKIHDTPVDMTLPVGKHKLRLVNAEHGKDETLTVTIDEKKSTTIERN